MKKFAFVRRFKSSSSDRWYTVKLNRETGGLSCNCPGWIFQRRGQPRTCKHLRSLVVADVIRFVPATVTA